MLDESAATLCLSEIIRPLGGAVTLSPPNNTKNGDTDQSSDVTSGAKEEKRDGPTTRWDFVQRYDMNPLFSLLVARLASGGLRWRRGKGNVLYVWDVNVEMHLCSLLIL